MLIMTIKKSKWAVLLTLSIITLSACGGNSGSSGKENNTSSGGTNNPSTGGSNEPAHIYGAAGSHSIASPIIESVNENSVLIIPKSASEEKPVPVVFLAPGFRSKDYTLRCYLPKPTNKL